MRESARNARPCGVEAKAATSDARGLCGIALGLVAFGCSDGSSTATAGSSRDAELTAQEQEGELVTYVADYEDGRSERWHALRQADGRELRLQFETTPAVSGGTRIRVRGSGTVDKYTVRDYEPLPGAQRFETATVTTTVPTQDTYALVLVDLGSGVDVTADAGQKAMFGTNPSDKSFASFYYESSYGKYSITGDVIGPYSYPMTGCNTTGMYQAIESQITKSYNHLIYYFKRTPSCAFGGLGEEGSVGRPAKRTWMNGSLGCVVLMQEPGHNLGLMHANTLKCGTASFSDTPATSCSITEYGNTLTPMGSGCHQLNGYEKWYSRWLSGCNGVRVTSTGSFNLVPLGLSCPDAVQVLQVPMPATRTVSDPQSSGTAVNLKNYYVELRAPAGVFDQYSNTRGAGSGVAFTQPVVSIYASDDVRTGAAVGRGGGNSNSVWTELLNMTPGAATFTGLTTPGQSFTDPSGSPTITLESISADGAVVAVTVAGGTGAATCADGTTLVGSGIACDGGAVAILAPDAGLSGVSDAGPASGMATKIYDAGAAGKPDSGVGGSGDESQGATRTGPADSAGLGPNSSGDFTGRSEDAAPAVVDTDAGSAAPSAAVPIGDWNDSHGCSCTGAGSPSGAGGACAIGAFAVAAVGSRRKGRVKNA